MSLIPLQIKKYNFILTNRDVIQLRLVIAKAIFLNGEEIPLYPLTSIIGNVDEFLHILSDVDI